jgi:transposase
MSKLDLEARMTIKTLAAKGVSHCEIARMLGVTEGAVRYQVKRMQAGAVDGRTHQEPRATAVAEAIEHWRGQQGDRAVNLAALHDWLVAEHGYRGSLRSVQRYWSRTYPAPAIRARRRVETPAAAQAQVDWAHFPSIVIGGERTELLALHMVLSHSRFGAIVWSHRKDQLSWLHCHTEAFKRLGGVTATVRVDNEKTAVVRGAGAWGTINTTYRRYAAMMRFHIDACPPRQPQTKGKVERRVRDQRDSHDPSSAAWRDLAELQAWSDERNEKSARRRRCPVTGSSVWEAWQDERALLGALPETLPEPFDVALTRRVGIDGLVSFEGRQYSVPFGHVLTPVEVRGCAMTVQVLADNAIVAVHPRHTPHRLVIDTRHYEGASTERVTAPPPLGRMGSRMLELAAEPVAHRAIDLYARLAEVAR